MKATSKLSAEERRAAIVKAARKVFAEKGFHGTTTKALAEAAGVSEALLFKHFPHKEALFSAMQLTCCDEQVMGRFERLKALEPSASTLAVMVHFLVSVVLGGDDAPNDESEIPYRLLLRSLAEDGEFARLLLRPIVADWVPKVQECIHATVAAGDAEPGPSLPSMAGWFSQHLACMIRFLNLPATPAVHYPVPRDQLVGQTVWFILRGMGLKEEVIRRSYNPGALALFAI